MATTPSGKRSSHFAPKVPTNAIAPVITGNLVSGQTLTTTDGYWLRKVVTITYQWYVDGAIVAGQTANTYVIQAGDVGKRVSVVITGANAKGSTFVTVPTAAVVLPTAPVNSVAPAISGNTTSGSVLTSTNGTWTGTPTYTYQWKRGAANIAGATASTYTTVAGDVGNNITLVVTGTNAGGSASATSNAIGPIT